MALTANRDLEFYASEQLIDLGVDDNIRVYRGAFVGRNRATGFARPLVAGDDFLGVAYLEADNTVAGHAAGGVKVRLRQSVDMVIALAGAAVGDIGKDVYASDDATLTLTPLGNSRIGRIVALEGSDVARVRCQPQTGGQGELEGRAVRQVSDATQALTLDHVNRVLLMANTTARTLTLPTAASCRAGSWVRVVKTSSAAAAITLDGNGSETIDGAATLATLDAQYDCAHLLCTGTEWIVLDRDIA